MPQIRPILVVNPFCLKMNIYKFYNKINKIEIILSDNTKQQDDESDFDFLLYIYYSK